jgi:predicted RNA methylase
VRRLEDVIGSKRPRRVLDLGAGVGAFAAWAGIAWPFSWVDCYERDMQLAEVCRRNLPPGGKMLSEAELLDVDVSKYAVIRVGDLAVMQSGAILDAVAVLIVDAVRE